MDTQFLIDNSPLIAAAVLSGALLLFPAIRGGGQRVAPMQASMMINRSRAQILDIRTDAELNALGRVPDAKCIPVADIKDKAPGQFKDKAQPVLVMCQNGQRSAAAASVLRSLGYTEVYIVEGGVAAWVEAGMPVTGKSGKQAKQAKSA